MRQWVCACVVAVLLSGCGGGSAGSGSTGTTSPPPAVYPSITGNWSISAASQITGGTTYIGAYLTNASGTVSGILHVINSGCYSLTEDVPVSGTITTAGIISVTSTAVASQTIAVTGTIGGNTLASGNYNITGGCAGGDKGTVTGYIVPPFTGTYTGTFVSPPEPAVTVSVTASQSGPNADGIYQVSGSATFGGSPCFSAGTITSSAISGGYIEVTITAANGGVVEFAGEITDSTGDVVDGAYQFTAGSCAGDSGTGSLTD